MKSDDCERRVLTVPRVECGGAEGVSIGGRLAEIGQSHLLGPFLDLVEAVERTADVAGGDEASGGEQTCIERLYRSLFAFFSALCPSANEELVHSLTYSVALLLVGEAIEVSHIVAPGPAAAAARIRNGRAGQ